MESWLWSQFAATLCKYINNCGCNKYTNAVVIVIAVAFSMLDDNLNNVVAKAPVNTNAIVIDNCIM
jgi:hypothetical protein